MKRILIVDDEFGLAETLCDLLHFEGYQTTSAWNGQLALEKVGVQAPDLILLDMMMPIMNGPRTLRALQANEAWRSIPVIAMSAVELKKDDGELAGCSAFLRKPFEIDQLLMLIRKLIS